MLLILQLLHTVTQYNLGRLSASKIGIGFVGISNLFTTQDHFLLGRRRVGGCTTIWKHITSSIHPGNTSSLFYLVAFVTQDTKISLTFAVSEPVLAKLIQYLTLLCGTLYRTNKETLQAVVATELKTYLNTAESCWPLEICAVLASWFHRWELRGRRLLRHSPWIRGRLFLTKSTHCSVYVSHIILLVSLRWLFIMLFLMSPGWLI